MRRPVTNGQYLRCVQDNQACPMLPGVRWQDRARRDLPIKGVTWQEANAYAAWAGGRLPAAAEWETACRAAQPTGASQDQPVFQAGIWEWTSSPYGEGSTAAGSPGGDYLVASSGGSCTFRDYLDPLDRHSFIGFRVIMPVAPGASG